MKTPVGADDAILAHMGVNFRGRYVRMPKQHLHGAQIGPAFKQMGGEGMAQGMGV
jgi:hypothetical protein